VRTAPSTQIANGQCNEPCLNWNFAGAGQRCLGRTDSRLRSMKLHRLMRADNRFGEASLDRSPPPPGWPEQRQRLRGADTTAGSPGRIGRRANMLNAGFSQARATSLRVGRASTVPAYHVASLRVRRHNPSSHKRAGRKAARSPLSPLPPSLPAQNSTGQRAPLTAEQGRLSVIVPGEIRSHLRLRLGNDARPCRLASSRPAPCWRTPRTRRPQLTMTFGADAAWREIRKASNSLHALSGISTP